jgi:hypothetical protein
MRKTLTLIGMLTAASLLSGCLAAAAVGAAGAVVGTAAGVAVRTTGAVIEEGVDIVTPGDSDDEKKSDDDTN